MGHPDFLVRLHGQVRARPHGPAVLHRGEVVLDFATLWARSRTLAAALRADGVGPERRVALDVARSAELVIGMVGTWMSGGAFLVLSALDPPARRAQILAEAAPARVLDRADIAALGATDDPPPPLDAPAPGQLAYAVFTSGSTGVPKGVLVTHDGIPALLTAQIAAFRLCPGARALWMLSPTFDASISDVTTTLASGGALCLEDATACAPEHLLDTLRARDITHVDLPPSLLTRLDPERAPPTLETIIIGGEVCPRETIRRWAARVHLVNVYGPTEATICASLVTCTTAWDRDAIGEPIDGVGFTIVDDDRVRATASDGDRALATDGDPAPASEGELWISGPAVARGYLHRPELDRARFVTRDGIRHYRTGDRVRREPDGALVFAGRFDRQVKLHGQRIELEEIERVFRACPGVENAAVVKVEPPALVAYVVPAQVDLGLLRRHAETHLPPYMIPTRIERLDVLPTTAIGKIDRGALEVRPAARPPQTPVERTLAEVWQEVLGGDAPTLERDFFAAGGDSIRALSLAARASARGYPMTPSAPYTHPTLGELAASIVDGARTEATDAIELEARAEPVARSPRTAREQRVLLVTGATGTLGRSLLPALLAHTSAEIIALVRAPDDARAAARLPIVDPRLGAIAGDLAQEHLGLSPDAWAALASRVDAVVHVAAEVHLIRPYAALAAANVEGTRRVLALGAPLHHVSTLSVFVATDRDRDVAREDDDLRATGRVWGGYAQSKWVAERCVRRSDPDARIYRLGLVTGDTHTGAHAPHDLLATFVRGVDALGVVPRGPITDTLALDVTPVDYAAETLARLIGSAPAGTYHVANPRSLRLVELVAAIERVRGAPLRTVAEDAWSTLRPRGIDETTAHLALSRVVPALHHRWRTIDLFQATGIRFDDRATRAVLPDLVCPAPDAALIELYVRSILQDPTARTARRAPPPTAPSSPAGR